MQYDQNIVLLISRSNASPEAACVIFQGRRVSLRPGQTQLGKRETYLCKSQGRRTRDEQHVCNDEYRAKGVS